MRGAERGFRHGVMGEFRGGPLSQIERSLNWVMWWYRKYCQCEINAEKDSLVAITSFN